MTHRVYLAAYRDGMSTRYQEVGPDDMGAEEWQRVERPSQEDTFYIDCEFDGHNGPLLSIAMVRGDGLGLHVKTGDHSTVLDRWVRENVLPIMDSHHAENAWHVGFHEVGTVLRKFIGDCQRPTIVADSPVDIARFCRAISTGEDGGWASTGFPRMAFEVRNVDCYPTALDGAVQHNAWWDAMALRAALDLTTEPEPTSGAYDMICCTAEDVVQGRGFTGDAAADLATAQESLRVCLALLRWRG